MTGGRYSAILEILALTIALCLAGGGKATADSPAEYSLILAAIDDAIAAETASLSDPILEALVQDSVFFSDGVTSNINSPCYDPGAPPSVLSVLPETCSITTPADNVIALRSFQTPVSWTTDASASDGLLTVDSVDPTLANFTALVAGTYHVVANLQVPNSSATLPITITINAVPAVTANAGVDQSVNFNSVVSLEPAVPASTACRSAINGLSTQSLQVARRC